MASTRFWCMRFDFLHVLELRRVEPGVLERVALLRDQIAVLVDHADVGRVQLRHARTTPDARCRRSAHGSSVRPACRLTSTEAEGFMLVAQEGGLFRDRQMHAGGAHGAERLDRARQFAFESALVVDLFGKLADAELLVFHHLEADQATFRQALRGQPQTDIVHHGRSAPGWRRRLRSTCREYSAVCKCGDDLPAVLFSQIGEQDAVGRLFGPQPGADQNGDGEAPPPPSPPVSGVR